jgi:hypothetical protein
MSPEERAGLFRVMALLHRKHAAECEMTASAVMATAALRGLTESMKASERRELAEHPDLAYLDAQLNGFYEPLTQDRSET